MSSCVHNNGPRSNRQFLLFSVLQRVRKTTHDWLYSHDCTVSTFISTNKTYLRAKNNFNLDFPAMFFACCMLFKHSTHKLLLRACCIGIRLHQNGTRQQHASLLAVFAASFCGTFGGSFLCKNRTMQQQHNALLQRMPGQWNALVCRGKMPRLTVGIRMARCHALSTAHSNKKMISFTPGTHFNARCVMGTTA